MLLIIAFFLIFILAVLYGIAEQVEEIRERKEQSDGKAKVHYTYTVKDE